MSLLAPSLSAILRLCHPSCPVCHIKTDFEEQPNLPRRHLEEHRIPARLSVVALQRLVVGSFWRLCLCPRSLHVLHRSDMRLCTSGVNTSEESPLRAKLKDTISSKHWLRPFVTTLLLYLCPDADVRVPLFCSSEISCEEVTIFQFYDGRCVSFRELRLVVHKLIVNDASVTRRYFTLHSMRS